MSTLRGVMMILMIVTAMIAWSTDTNSFSNYDIHDSKNDALYRMDFSYIYLIMPLVSLSLIFHYAIPTLSQACEDKERLSSMFSSGLVLCAIFYAAVASSVALYFGKDIEESSNVRWEHYVGIQHTSSTVIKVLSRICSVVVVYFPAYDCISIYALNAITLGNSLMGSYYGGDNIHLIENSRWIRTIFRLIASVPPIFVAYFVRDLSTINSYSGLTGFFIAFMIPPLLSHYSEKNLKSRGLNAFTVYSSKIWTGYWMRIIMVVLSLFLALYTLYYLIYTESKGSK
jgi:hypothetical protein